MAKQGMKRPEPEHRKNKIPPVPQINGKAFHGGPLNSNDLAVDNLLNDFDMTAADAQDFGRRP